MSGVVAIGDERRLAGYALAGAEVRHAASPADAEAAFAGLPEDTGLLVLTGESYQALTGLLADCADVVWAVVEG